MIICRQFAFIHLAKTGGTWLRDAMRKYPHPDWALEERVGHHPATEAPAGRPLLAAVRNPWDWYVSLYSFRRQHILHRTGDWVAPQEEWSDGMRNWARLIESQPDEIAGFRSVIRVLTGEGGKRTLPYGHEGIGSLTTRYERFLCDSDGRLMCEVIRFERLREEAEAFFTRHHIPMRDSFVEELRSGRLKNTSERRPYPDYYDEKSRVLVADADRPLIERYGYSFEKGGAD